MPGRDFQSVSVLHRCDGERPLLPRRLFDRDIAGPGIHYSAPIPYHRSKGGPGRGSERRIAGLKISSRVLQQLDLQFAGGKRCDEHPALVVITNLVSCDPEPGGCSSREPDLAHRIEYDQRLALSLE